MRHQAHGLVGYKRLIGIRDMSDYHCTEAEIDRLDDMLQDRLQRGSRADWRSVWDQIKAVGVGFKGARYPTREEHQRAWDRFQSLIVRVKDAQEVQRSSRRDECAKLEKRIDELESMLPGWFTSSKRTDWKTVWAQINIVSAVFKEVRCQTREDRDRAWSRFQKMVIKVKEAQNEEQEAWDRKRDVSERHKSEILSWARSADPSSGLADTVLALATGGISIALNALLGPLDERKAELQRCSAALKQGGDLLHEYKDEMLGRDKQEAFQVLQAAREKLDSLWESYKHERESAYAKQQESWTQRVNERIVKLEERIERLSAVLSKKESHLSDLYRKLGDARSDDYRSVVSGWIREEESAIQEIREKIRSVEIWRSEERDKLRR